MFQFRIISKSRFYSGLEYLELNEKFKVLKLAYFTDYSRGLKFNSKESKSEKNQYVLLRKNQNHIFK